MVVVDRELVAVELVELLVPGEIDLALPPARVGHLGRHEPRLPVVVGERDLQTAERSPVAIAGLDLVDEGEVVFDGRRLVARPRDDGLDAGHDRPPDADHGQEPEPAPSAIVERRERDDTERDTDELGQPEEVATEWIGDDPRDERCDGRQDARGPHGPAVESPGEEADHDERAQEVTRAKRKAPHRAEEHTDHEEWRHRRDADCERRTHRRTVRIEAPRPHVPEPVDHDGACRDPEEHRRDRTRERCDQRQQHGEPHVPPLPRHQRAEREREPERERHAPDDDVDPCAQREHGVRHARRRARSELVGERGEGPCADEGGDGDDHDRSEPGGECRRDHAVSGGRVAAVPVVVPHAGTRPFPDPRPEQMRRIVGPTDPGGEDPGGHGDHDQARDERGRVRARRGAGTRVRTNRCDRHGPQSITAGNGSARRGTASGPDTEPIEPVVARRLGARNRVVARRRGASGAVHARNDTAPGISRAAPVSWR